MLESTTVDNDKIRSKIFVLENGYCDIHVKDDNDLWTQKYLEVGKLAEVLNASLGGDTLDIDDDYTLTPIMPCDSIAACITIKQVPTKGYTWYLVLRQPVPTDFLFFNTTFKNIGMPYTLFALKVSNDLVTDMRIVCTKSRVITEETLIYSYPFSNVNTVGGVCLGGNSSTFLLENNYSILNIPEMFLTMPNSDHSYGHNNSGLSYRDLLTQLEGKPFNEEWLRPNNMTFKTFLGTLR